MNTMHEQVTHPKFGTGTVIAQDESTVTVKFSKEAGSKKFLYPSAFQSFLELRDPSVKEQMDHELQSVRAAETERSIRLVEREKMRAMLEAKSALKKRAAAKRRPPKKSREAEGEASRESV